MSADNIDEALRYRSELPQLLAANPNYFGNLVDVPFEPKLQLINDTAFEEVSCVGFNPDTDVLEATVQIKLPTGYGGDLCSAGTWQKNVGYDDVGFCLGL